MLIGGTMGTCSYVLTGTDKGFRDTFGSTCHGAGRAQSRAKSRRSLDYTEVLAKLAKQGIAIRVASPKLVMEEAPESYKNVTAVRGVFCSLEWAAYLRSAHVFFFLLLLKQRCSGGQHMPCGRHQQGGLPPATHRCNQGIDSVMGFQLTAITSSVSAKADNGYKGQADVYFSIDPMAALIKWGQFQESDHFGSHFSTFQV